jgi:hypothetical protein
VFGFRFSLPRDDLEVTALQASFICPLFDLLSRGPPVSSPPVGFPDAVSRRISGGSGPGLEFALGSTALPVWLLSGIAVEANVGTAVPAQTVTLDAVGRTVPAAGLAAWGNRASRPRVEQISTFVAPVSLTQQ